MSASPAPAPAAMATVATTVAPPKVIVIGASAGGIEALTAVISRLPAEMAAAVLVVQHLRPGRPTGLAGYLDRLSALRVIMAADGMAVEAGRVAVAEPGRHLRIEDGRMRFDDGERVNYVRPAADVLFASAAEACGDAVIGVVLSGTGRDGAAGCAAIKASGGMTMVQDPAAARAGAMPQAAIDRGAVDLVLPLEEIAAKLAALTAQTQEASEP